MVRFHNFHTPTGRPVECRFIEHGVAPTQVRLGRPIRSLVGATLAVALVPYGQWRDFTISTPVHC